MEENAVILYVMVCIGAFIAGIFITRAIFSIPKFLRLQEAQLQVLTEIAKKHGVSANVLFVIHENLGILPRPKTDEELKKEQEKETGSSTTQSTTIYDITSN